ncbi:glycoside hydrolase family 24 protein [Trichophyton violaceum]|uniref:Glycoside hydrolase family 24 protein n=1 Tax=Trichophyton violaceum TaxID=34388 RepID=A0A178FKK9_TRIVO|nr:glycoside hydrolase family 24 protein [Trichophyton violaceum]
MSVPGVTATPVLSPTDITYGYRLDGYCHASILSMALGQLSYYSLSLPWPSSKFKRDCIGSNVNDETIGLIKHFEGFVLRPAPDPIGLPTVGYGHLCRTKGCSEVSFPFFLTEETATELLIQDVKSSQQSITLSTTDQVVFNANQSGALVSWAYNVGGATAKKSSLISRLNREQDVDAVIREELPLWNKAGRHVLPGQVRRRAAEVELASGHTDQPPLLVDCYNNPIGQEFLIAEWYLDGVE